MAHMNEADLLLGLAKSLHHAVDPVARKAEDGVYAPRDQAFYEYVRSIHCKFSSEAGLSTERS